MESEVIKALRALVELKDHKDKYGKTEHYTKNQPLAWSNARRALNSIKQQ